jgi:hypothetical protein
MSEESEASLIENQDCVFDRFQTLKAIFIRNLYLQVRLLPSITTGKCRSSWENVVAQFLINNAHWESTSLDLIRYNAVTFGFGEIPAIS